MKKKNIIISGIQEERGENCVELAQQSTNERLELNNVKVAVAHRIGSGSNRSMLAQLEYPMDEGNIFKNVHKLKGMKNGDGRFFYINDQLPAVLQEVQRRQRQIMKDNRKKISLPTTPDFP